MISKFQDTNMPKIFVIGFNKTATRAFHNLFKNSGIASVHWDEGKLARTMIANDVNGQPLLSGYENTIAFSDMEFVSEKEAMYVHMTHYQKLFHQYPNSYFILNTRNIAAWIASRKAHANGKYLLMCMESQRLSEEEMVAKWHQEFCAHCREVVDFFNGYERFIQLNIDEFNIQELIKFLAVDFKLDVSKWEHLDKHKSNNGLKNAKN